MTAAVETNGSPLDNFPIVSMKVIAVRSFREAGKCPRPPVNSPHNVNAGFHHGGPILL